MYTVEVMISAYTLTEKFDTLREAFQALPFLRSNIIDDGGYAVILITSKTKQYERTIEYNA